MTVSTLQQRAWAAGLFDGEGCISFSNGDAPVVIRLNMQDKAAVTQFGKITGLKVHGPYLERNGHKKWEVWAATHVAAAVLRYLGRWLVTKRDKARLALRIADTAVTQGKRPTTRQLATRARLLAGSKGRSNG